MTVIYLSGAMTKEPHHRQIFEFYEDLFEEAGYEVLNPVWISDYLIEENGLNPKEAWSPTWRNFFLREDVRAMLECDKVVMLPNWKKSEGAKLEHKIAKLMGMEICYA